MNRKNKAAIVAAMAGLGAHAQPTVPFSSTGWMDFGTTNITGVAGNFLPGWTTLTGSPDLGFSPFFIPTTTLSGAPNDAALWILNFNLGTPQGASSESVRLSLDGFTPGQTYELAFSATIHREPFAGWNGNNYPLDVAIAGASITSFATSILNDPADSDGMNVWTPQSIVFTALAPNVVFDFGGAPIGLDPLGGAARFGIDGMQARLVPTPGAAVVLLAGIGVARGCRRR